MSLCVLCVLCGGEGKGGRARGRGECIEKFIGIKNGLSFLKCYIRKRVSLEKQILLCVKTMIMYFNE